MNALADLRARVAGALDGLDLDDVTVLADAVDALTPPAFMLVWNEEWGAPYTHCAHLVRLDVLVVGARLEPASGVDQIELMIAAAVPTFRATRLPEVAFTPPARFDIGGVAYLATRLRLAVPLALTTNGVTP